MLKVAFIILVACLGCDQRKTESSSIAETENDKNFETREGKKDAEFVVETIADNYAEIRFAQLAINKSDDPELREIASLMEKDHAKVLNKLKGVANKKGITIPLEETEGDREKLDDLANKTRNDFDEKWCKDQTKRNERTIQSFEAMWEKTKDPDLKEWINATLPDLRNHVVKLKSHQEKLAMK